LPKKYRAERAATPLFWHW